jgi:hypothetical protein
MVGKPGRPPVITEDGRTVKLPAGTIPCKAAGVMARRIEPAPEYRGYRHLLSPVSAASFYAPPGPPGLLHERATGRIDDGTAAVDHIEEFQDPDPDQMI